MQVGSSIQARMTKEGCKLAGEDIIMFTEIDIRL